MNKEKQAKINIDLKRGWYKKGNTHRFLYGIDTNFFYLYQTKTKFGSKEVTGVNAMFDEWFKNAEYIGLELELKNE